MKKNISILLALSLMSSILVGCSEDTTSSAQTPSITVSSTAVEVLEVSSSDLSNEVRVSGKIAADREVSVFALMSSDVTKLSVEIGDKVSKGQFLFSLDKYSTSDFTRELENLNTTYESTKELLEEATTQIQKALDDTRALYEIGASSKYEVEQLEFSLMQQESTNKTQLDSIQNGIDQLTSQMKDLNENSTVTAPIAGVVTQVNLVQNMMATNAQPAVVIADTSQMQIQLSVAETIIPYIKTGDSVLVTIPSQSIEPFEAKVRNVSPSTNIQTGMYTVRIDLPKNQEYFIGMFAEVSFKTDEVLDSVNIPSSSIINGDSSQYVFVVENNTAYRVDITTGMTTGSNTQVLSGLLGGEQLVITGQDYLSDNSLVVITGGK